MYDYVRQTQYEQAEAVWLNICHNVHNLLNAQTGIPQHRDPQGVPHGLWFFRPLARDNAGRVYWIIRMVIRLAAAAINWQHRFNWLWGVQSKQFSITRHKGSKPTIPFDFELGLAFAWSSAPDPASAWGLWLAAWTSELALTFAFVSWARRQIR